MRRSFRDQTCAIVIGKAGNFVAKGEEGGLLQRFYKVRILQFLTHLYADMIFVKCFTPAHLPIFQNLPEKSELIATLQTLIMKFKHLYQ